MADSSVPIPPRPVMMHPKDYRKPNGMFDSAYCDDIACSVSNYGHTQSTYFDDHQSALTHARISGHKMTFRYRSFYSVQAT